MISPDDVRREPPVLRKPLHALLRAGLVTGVIDGLFASALSVFVYESTATRLFQGVAATLLGPGALEGGRSTAIVGLLMHFGVAFAWSAVFLLVVMRSGRIRSLVSSRAGALGVASLYGPCIWLVMSLGLIPFLVGRPPAMTGRWFIQLLGHIPFVAVPIVMSIRSGVGHSERSYGV